MNALELTPHAISQLTRRAIAEDDLDLLMMIGTCVESGYLVREKDFQLFEHHLKRLRDRARRLVGKRLVVEGDQIVTAYHAGRGKERRLLRGAEKRSFKTQD